MLFVLKRGGMRSDLTFKNTHHASYDEAERGDLKMSQEPWQLLRALSHGVCWGEGWSVVQWRSTCLSLIPSTVEGGEGRAEEGRF